jgi:hypothetical protein
LKSKEDGGQMRPVADLVGEAKAVLVVNIKQDNSGVDRFGREVQLKRGDDCLTVDEGGNATRFANMFG